METTNKAGWYEYMGTSLERIKLVFDTDNLLLCPCGSSNLTIKSHDLIMTIACSNPDCAHRVFARYWVDLAYLWNFKCGYKWNKQLMNEHDFC